VLLDLCNLLYIKSTSLLFSSFVPSHLHWWKVENFMKVAKVGEDESFDFVNICSDCGQFFWYHIIMFNWFICFTHCWHLHWVLLEGTFVKQQGWGRLFFLVYIWQLLCLFIYSISFHKVMKFYNLFFQLLFTSMRLCELWKYLEKFKKTLLFKP
jgi:hypothetical protein